MTHELLHYGLWLLFLLVAVESAGVPLPGETSLIVAAYLARPSQPGHFSIFAVIAVAASAAIIGDNVGYALGRFGGRRLLERWGPVKRYADRALPPAEAFFRRHGGKSVFLARFVIGIRVIAAWVAGISRMKWERFLFFNAAGGIVWAAAVGTLAYWAGKTAADAISKYGLYAIVVLVVLGAIVFVVHRRMTKRTESG